MSRRAIAIAILIATLIAACDRVIDLSRRGGADAASDVGPPNDGGTDGGPDDGGADDGGGGLDS